MARKKISFLEIGGRCLVFREKRDAFRFSVFANYVYLFFFFLNKAIDINFEPSFENFSFLSLEIMKIIVEFLGSSRTDFSNNVVHSPRRIFYFPRRQHFPPRRDAHELFAS